MAAAQEPAPPYVGPWGVPHNIQHPRAVEYAGMLSALRVPAVVTNYTRMEQITEILEGHNISARDVYEVLRDLDHTVEVPSPDHLPSPAMMRRTMAAMLEIRLNYTRAQALDLVDKGRSANVGAIASLIGQEALLAGSAGVQGAGCIYVMGCAKAGMAANMAIIKSGAASVTAAAKGKAVACFFGAAGVAVLATFWGLALVIKTPVEAVSTWHANPEALFLQRSKDAAIVSHVIDGVVFRYADGGYYDQHHAQ